MSIFDFNRDGEVSSSEQAFGLGAILAALSETEAEVKITIKASTGGDEDYESMDRDELEAFWRNSKSNAKIWKMRSRTILAAMPTMSGRSDVKISMKRSRKSKNCWMTDGDNL